MPKQLESCVRKVRAKGGVKSPWAVCVVATGIKKKKDGGWTEGKRTLRNTKTRG